MSHVFDRFQHFVDTIVATSYLKENEDLVRLNHYIWLVLIAFPISLFFVFYNIYLNQITLAYIIGGFCCILSGSVVFLRYISNMMFVYHLNNFVFVLFLCTLIYFGGEEGSRILWCYTYPLASIFLFGGRLGSFWSILLLICAMTLLSVLPWDHNVYSQGFKLRFAITYFSVLSTTLWIEYYRYRYAQKAQENHEALLTEHEHLEKEIARRTKLEKELLLHAQTDSLTALLNRRHFWELAQKEIDRAKRYNLPLCMAVLDIDHFKKINDTYGHPMGDEVLRLLARHCQHALRSSDLLGRIGGEEFAFLLVHVNLNEAHEKMESLRHEIEHLTITNAHYSLRFTASIGLAQIDATTDNLDKLYKKADDALYQAKNKGRNCVENA